jgi:TolA-binding protein
VNIETGVDYFDDEPQFVADDETEVAQTSNLGRLSKLAAQARELEVEIEQLSLQMEEKNEKLTKIRREFIPDLMTELGIDEFKLSDGSKISVKDVVTASPKEENKPLMHAWLEEHGYDGIIKTKVATEFGKGEIDDARKAHQALIDAGYHATLNRNVHYQTLQAFVRERLEDGEAIPTDIFGVFEYKEAKITPPKSGKTKRK